MTLTEELSLHSLKKKKKRCLIFLFFKIKDFSLTYDIMVLGKIFFTKFIVSMTLYCWSLINFLLKKDLN